MKKLDEKVVYDITNLSTKQLQILLDYLNTIKSPYEYLNAGEQRSKYPGNIYLNFDGYNKWYFTGVKRYNWPSVDALTLFEEDVLKIGDTFEHNGFVCEVKEKIEEKKWYRIIDRIGNLYFEKMPKERAEQAVNYEVKSITEITNKEFIAQLEENAR